MLLRIFGPRGPFQGSRPHFNFRGARRIICLNDAFRSWDFGKVALSLGFRKGFVVRGVLYTLPRVTLSIFQEPQERQIFDLRFSASTSYFSNHCSVFLSLSLLCIFPPKGEIFIGYNYVRRLVDNESWDVCRYSGIIILQARNAHSKIFREGYSYTFQFIPCAMEDH